MGRVFELFDLNSEIKDTKNPIQMLGLNNNIKFENVNFEYIPNQPVLKNFNLTVNKNETLAIVGNSGGGKSTLVNLLPRFYDIKFGSIKFDEIDIRNLSLKSLRQNISMVFQDNFLYSGTIKENIMMGKPDATTDELMQAIQSAYLQDMMQENLDKFKTWKKLKFDILFVGDDWYETEKWQDLEKKFDEVGVRVIYFPYTTGTSSTLINQTLVNIRNMQKTPIAQ